MKIIFKDENEMQNFLVIVSNEFCPREFGYSNRQPDYCSSGGEGNRPCMSCWLECGLEMVIENRKTETKPPLGLMPRYLWERNRRYEVGKAMSRYVDADKKIPIEWLDEYNELVEKDVDRLTRVLTAKSGCVEDNPGEVDN